MWALRSIGILYLLSGLWCALNPQVASEFLGYMLTNVGLSEFFAVYGGLQVGLGVAMLIASIKTEYIEASLLFASITSLGLLIFRLIALVRFDASEGIVAMVILEAVIVIVLGLQYRKSIQYKV
jgi:hypothetical protein